MAFNAANLAYNRTIIESRMWDYDAGSDNLSVVEDGFAGGYFASAAKVFRNAEMVRVTANDGNALYLTGGINPSSGFEQVSLTKLAAGVTSFPS